MKKLVCKSWLVKRGFCKSWLVEKLVCVEAGMCKTLEIEHKGVKLVGARGMAVRVHAEKAVSGEEEQEWQVLMESVGHKSGRLRRRNLWRKHRNMPLLRGENGP